MKDAIEILQQNPVKHGARPFLIDGVTGATLTYAQFHARAAAVGAQLAGLGLGKGDRLAVLAGNSAALAELYFGCLYRGVVVVPLNPVLSEAQIGFIIRHSGARVLVVATDVIKKVSVPALAKDGVRVLLLGAGDPATAPKGGWPVDLPVFESLPAADGFVPLEGISARDDLVIVYTSGTTADPKGVVHRIGSLLGNGALFCKQLGITPENRFINLLSMTYLGGYYNLLLLPYTAGASVVVTRTFGADAVLNFWKPIRAHGVNTLWLVPTIMSILMELDRGAEGPEYARAHVKLVLAGTAPLPQPLRNDFEARYGVRICENYGLSETFFITTNTPADPGPTGGVGQRMPGVAVRLVDKAGRDAEAGAEGEILVQTPYLMRGYFNHDHGDADALEPAAWFATGDIGRWDSAGRLFITGRKKDLIIRGGINISPAAIEDVLHRHPAVRECAAVGMPHPLMGEDITAVVRLDEGADFGAVIKELKLLCKKQLAAVQQPSQYVELEEFPHSSSGKIQKAKIRLWLEEKLRAGGDQPAPAGPRLNESRYFQPSRVVAASSQAMSIKYNNMVYEMKRRGEDVTVLSLGEAFFDIPLFDFKDLPFPQIYHYSHSRGVPELREKLARYFLDHYEVHFDPEREIIITAGSKIAIHMALMAVLNPGDEALIHEPAWVSYPEQVKLCYGVPVMVPHYAEVLDFEKYITNRTKVIIINNPNNPRGNVFTLEELSHLYKLAEKYNLFVLSDEAYSDFLLEEERFISIGNLDREKRRLILCNSMSKNYGMSGWRVGYVITNADMIDQILKINQHLVTCPATILEYYLARHFDEIIRITKPQIADVVKRRQAVGRYMDRIGLRYLPGTATFYFFVSIAPSRLGSEEFCTRLLQEHHICVVPGLGYGPSCDAFVRVSIGTESMERIERGLDTLKLLIEKTR